MHRNNDLYCCYCKLIGISTFSKWARIIMDMMICCTTPITLQKRTCSINEDIGYPIQLQSYLWIGMRWNKAILLDSSWPHGPMSLAELPFYWKHTIQDGIRYALVLTLRVPGNSIDVDTRRMSAIWLGEHRSKYLWQRVPIPRPGGKELLGASEELKNQWPENNQQMGGNRMKSDWGIRCKIMQDLGLIGIF